MSMSKNLLRASVALVVIFSCMACIQKSGANSETHYQPCEDILCGEPCSVCSPLDAECVAPGTPTVCNGVSECVVQAGTQLNCDANECAPGSSFESADGCNTCRCPDSGRRDDAECSTGVCTPDRCEAESVFDADDGCNVCRCPDSGLRADAVCTERDCSERCEPGESFVANDGCNSCECPESGLRGEAACSEIECARPCDGKRCGDDCMPQSQAGAPPSGESNLAPVRYQCDSDGECVSADAVELECLDRCENIPCGEPCRDVDGASADRLPTPGTGGAPGLELCNAGGDCVWTGSPNDIECGSACDGLACGDLCEPGGNQPAGDSASDRAAAEPPDYRCDQSGSCVANWDPDALMCE